MMSDYQQQQTSSYSERGRSRSGGGRRDVSGNGMNRVNYKDDDTEAVNIFNHIKDIYS